MTQRHVQRLVRFTTGQAVRRQRNPDLLNPWHAHRNVDIEDDIILADIIVDDLDGHHLAGIIGAKRDRTLQ